MFLCDRKWLLRSFGCFLPPPFVTTYFHGANGSQTGLVSQMQNGSLGTYSYTYDANGNIATITSDGSTTTYHYDSANQLIREDNQAQNHTTTYTYDGAGNILTRVKYSYTNPNTAVSDTNKTAYTVFTYSTGDWKDQLVSVSEYSVSSGVASLSSTKTVAYDASGNPTSYKGNTLTWEGRKLKSHGGYTYEYDENGLRTSKTVSGVTTEYYYNGSLLMGLKRGSDTLLFSYDAAGSVVSVNFNGTEYYYLKNAQSDIVGIVNSAGTQVVSYSYDAWGKPISTTGTMSSTLGTYNPFRYRGYVYDTETQLYYLQSRYYDPSYGRFLNADGYVSTGQGILGYNMYAYCMSNFVNYYDHDGKDAIWIQEEESAGWQGHTGLLVQDENGDWYYFYWGPVDESFSLSVLTGADARFVYKCIYIGDEDLTDIDKVKEIIANSDDPFISNRADKVTGIIYLEGSYISTHEYLLEGSQNTDGHKNSYFLLIHNCLQVSYYALSLSDKRFTEYYPVHPNLNYYRVKALLSLSEELETYE